MAFTLKNSFISLFRFPFLVFKYFNKEYKNVFFLQITTTHILFGDSEQENSDKTNHEKYSMIFFDP